MNLSSVIVEKIKRAGGVTIVGTDTEIGKTYVSCELLHALGKQGLRCVGLKPIASGCERNTASMLESDDALKLIAASTLQLPYETINPARFERPISPNLAAMAEGKTVTADELLRLSQPAFHANADVIVVETAGGWQSPINDHETMADLALAFKLPVILVVGIKLGCINHSVLTWQNIAAYNMDCLGWVANDLHSNPECAGIVNTISALIHQPPLITAAPG